MIKGFYKTLFMILSLTLFNGCADQDQSAEYEQPELYYQMVTSKTFEEVLDDAIFAITERNFRLTANLKIGKAIRDRGYDDFPNYQVLLYCNLAYTREMLEMDANVINSCPGRVNIRQTDDQVVISGSLWSQAVRNEALESRTNKMNVLVREIVDYAADDWTVYH